MMNAGTVAVQLRIVKDVKVGATQAVCAWAIVVMTDPPPSQCAIPSGVVRDVHAVIGNRVTVATKKEFHWPSRPEGNPIATMW